MSIDTRNDALISDLGVPLSEANVLVVEDEPLMSALLGRYIQQMNSQNHEYDLRVSTLEHGWDLLGADLSQIKVAVIDILLPKVNGVDLIRDFRKRYPNMGIVPISGMATEPFRRQLLDLLPPGFQLIDKPLRPEIFNIAFHEALIYEEKALVQEDDLSDETGEPMWQAVPTNTSEIRVPTSHRKLLRKRPSDEDGEGEHE